jgi:hypothetical protein
MVTTIIAIYGAVVATVSTLLGVWYFARSGPSLQAEASVDPVAIGEEIDRDWDNIECILLQVWNAGRAEVTVDIMALMVHLGNNHQVALPFINPYYEAPDLDGPELPIRIPGHSGERWLIGGIDPRRSIDRPWTSATLSVKLMVGGRRVVDVPVQDGSYRRIKRRFILKPPRELEPQPEVPTTRVVRQQPVRQARNKRSGKR